jgi:hypothetical protein
MYGLKPVPFKTDFAYVQAEEAAEKVVSNRER